MYTILYVDDELGLLEICKFFLEETGEFTVRTMSSALKAIESPEILSYDAIISDYQMPEMDGISFLKAVRAKSRDIPFILFTGRGREDVVIEAINNGADFYLQKGGDSVAQFAELVHKIKISIEHRRAIKASIDSEQRLTDIINFLPDATLAIDQTGQIIAWNHAIEQMTGTAAADIIGKGNYEGGQVLYAQRRPMLVDLVLRDDQHFEELHYSHTARSSNLLTAETLWQTEGKPPRYLWGVAARLFDKEGRCTGAIESIRDITDRKFTENAIKKNEEKYRTIVENVIDVVYRTDRTMTVIFATPSILPLLGCDSFSDIIGKPTLVWWAHPESRNDMITAIREKGCVRDYEALLRKKDGTELPVAINCHFYYDDDGTVAGIEGVIHDITEQRRAENRLKSNQALLETAIDLAHVTTWEYDMKSGSFIFNDRWFALYGTTAEREGGNTMSAERYAREFMPPDEAPMIEEEIKKVAATRDPGFSRVFEHGIIRRDGEIRTIIVRYRVECDNAGNITRVLGANQDITDLRRIEQGLRLANKKLSLLSSITRHDIRNQLSLLKGYLALTDLSFGDTPKREEFLRKAKTVADSIEHQINFTKDYENLGVNAPAFQDVNVIVSRAMAVLDMQDVRVENRADGLEIYADPLLEKVFYNVFDNALRYGGKRLTTIRCSYRNENNSLILVIENDGAGIPPDDKPHLFDEGHGKNTGLGLFLSREILAITGITITETGEYDKGARFELAIPKGAWKNAAVPVADMPFNSP